MLYVLIRFIISLVVVLIALTICCMTCCIVLLPYLGTVITLPLWVFKRCYSLYFLGQFGPDFSPIAAPGAAPVPISPGEPAPQSPHDGPIPED